jgi:hypothetical protein
MKLLTFLISALSIVVLLSCNTKNEPVTDPGYDKLANPEKGRTLTISDHNTDNPEKSIKCPKKNSIETKLDTTLLFRTWVGDPNGPHADFDFSSKSFYIADYDGDGDRPYTLKGNKLSIQYEDYVEEAEILSVSKDTLKIIWKGVDVPISYTIWKG